MNPGVPECLHRTRMGRGENRGGGFHWNLPGGPSGGGGGGTFSGVPVRRGGTGLGGTRSVGVRPLEEGLSEGRVRSGIGTVFVSVQGRS